MLYNYSVRKLFTGLIEAAFTVRDPTVTNAIKEATRPAPTKNNGLRYTCEA